MEYKTDAVLDIQGNAIFNASVRVLTESRQLATVYNTSGVPIPNPVGTDKTGEYSLALPNGKYFLEISVNGIVYETKGPVSFFDAQDDRVSVSDFSGADSSGASDSLAAFNSAAAKGKTVLIPAGLWMLSAPVSTQAMWFIESGARIIGLPDIAPGPGGGVMNDTSRLTGKVFHLANIPGYTGVRVGDPYPWLEKDVRKYTESIAEMAVLSATGQIALIGASRTSDDPTANFACIGLNGYAINDNTSVAEPAWAAYLESRRSAGAGATYGFEADMVNRGSTFDLDPFTTISTTTGQTVQCWLTNGGGDVALGGLPASAAVAIHPNPSSFKRAFVIRSGSLDGTTNEVMAMPQDYRAAAWYTSTGVLRGFLGGGEFKQSRLSNTANQGVKHEYVRLRANGTDATGALDVVQRNDYTAYTGAGGYGAGFQQIIQRTAFASGNARFSWDLQVTGDGGTAHQISLNGLGNNSFAPLSTIDFGNTSFVWGNGYFTGLRVKEGTNAKQGVATLAGGTVTVSNNSITANSRIQLTSQADGGTPGFLRVSARVAGTSFTITSGSASDTSTVAYQIFEPA